MLHVFGLQRFPSLRKQLASQVSLLTHKGGFVSGHTNCGGCGSLVRYNFETCFVGGLYHRILQTRPPSNLQSELTTIYGETADCLRTQDIPLSIAIIWNLFLNNPSGAGLLLLGYMWACYSPICAQDPQLCRLALSSVARSSSTFTNSRRS